MEEKKEQKELHKQLIVAQHKFMKLHKCLCFPEMGKSEFFMLDMIVNVSRSSQEAKGAYVSEIARKLKISTPAVSKMLKGLEEKQFIVRRTDERDRRNTIVSITQRGEEARQKVFAQMDNFAKDTVERMGEENVRELVRLLEEYTEIVREESLKMKVRMQEERNETDF